MEEHSSDHPGEADDNSDLAQQQERDAMEAKNGFWSISISFFIRHHVQERQHLAWTNTTSDVFQEGQAYDFVNVDGDQKLSGPWTDFTQST